MDEFNSSSLTITTGEDVLASIPKRIASSLSNPFILLPNTGIASLIDSLIYSGRILLRFDKVYSPLVFGVISPNLVDLILSLKSLYICTGIFPLPSI